MGRSIVVHDADKGAGRMGCADIVPFGNSYKFKEMYIAHQEGAYRYVKLNQNLNLNNDSINTLDYYKM